MSKTGLSSRGRNLLAGSLAAGLFLVSGATVYTISRGNAVEKVSKVDISYECETGKVEESTGLEIKKNVPFEDEKIVNGQSIPIKGTRDEYVASSVTGQISQTGKEKILWAKDDASVSYEGRTVFIQDGEPVIEEMSKSNNKYSLEGAKVHFTVDKQDVPTFKAKANRDGDRFCWEHIYKIQDDPIAVRPVAHWKCVADTLSEFKLSRANPNLRYSYQTSDGIEYVNIQPIDRVSTTVDELVFPSESIQVKGVSSKIEVFANSLGTSKKLIENEQGNVQLREVMFAPKFEVQNHQQRNQLKKIAEKYGAEACKVSELQTARVR